MRKRFGVSLLEQAPTPPIEVIRNRVFGQHKSDGFPFRFRECDVQRASDLLGDVRLQREHLTRCETRAVTVRPELGVVRRLDEARCDTDLTASRGGAIGTQRTLQHVVHLEGLSNLGNGQVTALVPLCAGARHDAESANPGDTARDFFGNAVGQVLVVCGTQVFDRQDRKLRRLKGLTEVVPPRHHPGDDGDDCDSERYSGNDRARCDR